MTEIQSKGILGFTLRVIGALVFGWLLFAIFLNIT